MSTTGEVISFDLSAYAGQSEVRITFESTCKYGPFYATGAYAGMILVDNISIDNVSFDVQTSLLIIMIHHNCR